jgi:hypothetical protein
MLQSGAWLRVFHHGKINHLINNQKSYFETIFSYHGVRCITESFLPPATVTGSVCREDDHFRQGMTCGGVPAQFHGRRSVGKPDTALTVTCSRIAGVPAISFLSGKRLG